MSAIPVLAAWGPFPVELWNNLYVVLTLFYLIWIYGWAKKALGSAKLAILFAVIVVYLLFIEFPQLVWIPLIIFLLATFGGTMFEKIGLPEKSRWE